MFVPKHYMFIKNQQNFYRKIKLKNHKWTFALAENFAQKHKHEKQTIYDQQTKKQGLFGRKKMVQKKTDGLITLEKNKN